MISVGKLIRLSTGVVACLVAVCASAQPGALDFAFLITNANSVAAGNLLVDEAGNSYITGAYQGTIDFDPGRAMPLGPVPMAVTSGKAISRNTTVWEISYMSALSMAMGPPMQQI